MSEKYKAPMTIVEGPTIFEQVADEIEDRIAYRATAQLGVVVDKEELQKALVYDRHQYEAGYHDGYRTAMQEKAEWISVKDRLPESEQDVLVCVKRKFVAPWHRGLVITNAMYEDGTVSEVDSKWSWSFLDFEEWDDEKECGIVPKGWYENHFYYTGSGYNIEITDEIVAWMPLPELPESEE